MVYIPHAKPRQKKTTTISKTFSCVGVDFRQDETASYRSPDSVNMYRSESGEWETHPGFRIIGVFPVVGGEDYPVCYSCVKFQYTDSTGTTYTKVLLHAGKRLYTWNNYPNPFTAANLTAIYTDMPVNIMKYATFKKKDPATGIDKVILVILGGGKLLYYDGTSIQSMITNAFVPQTMQLKSPNASAGTAYQQRNLLQPGFIEGFVGNYYQLTDTFTATASQTTFTTTRPIKALTSVFKNATDVTSTTTNTTTTITLGTGAAAGDTIKITYYTGDNVYQLSTKGLDATAVTAKVTTGGVESSKTEGTHFTVNRTTGVVTWTTGNYPPKPDIDGTENVKIYAYKTTAGYADMIVNCTEMLVFDNRLFLTGNPVYPNRIFWTGFQEPSYFGDGMFNDRAGSGSVPITALQMLSSNAFLALKKSTLQDGSYSVIVPQELDDNNNPKTYTAKQGSGTIGCTGRDAAAVFVDDNVFVGPNGLNAISRELNISNERNTEHRSTLVDSRLMLEDLSRCICKQYANKLYILCPSSGNVYIADAFLTNKPGELSPYIEYEWAFLSGIGVYKDSGRNLTDTDGTFYPSVNIEYLGDKELYLCCDGCLCKFNFDLSRLDKVNELTPAAYYYNGRPIGDYYKTSFDWMGKTNYYKRLMNEHNDLLLKTRVSSRANITWRTDQTLFENSKVINIMSQGVSYAYANYNSRKYGALPEASFVLKKLKTKDFRRMQVCLASATAGVCTAFSTLTLEAELLDNDLK